MRRVLLALTVVAVVVLSLVLVRFIFYPGKYQSPVLEKPSLEDISVAPPVLQPFVQEYKAKRGALIIDLAHNNDFAPWELNVFLSRVVARGFTFEYLKGPGVPEEEGNPAEERPANMKEKLRYADALAIILPREPFSFDEVGLIEGFVEKGGKLLLIGDSTRPSEINSISAQFGLIFETDYLYNLKEYDGNYQNIFVTEFAETPEITRNLAKIVLYSAGSITAPEKGIAFTDENTFSSVIETKGKLSPLALTEESKVLAISDLTFMREPFNAVWDNNQLVSNIADWLTESRRIFVLADFPYFLEQGVFVAYSDPSIIDIGIELKNFLVEKGKSPEIRQYQDLLATSKDTVFLGFFKDTGPVEKYLERGKISVTVKAGEEKPAPKTEGEDAEKERKEQVTITTIEIEGIGQVYQEEGTSILYLDQENGGDVLIVLSDSEERLKDAVSILKNGKFRDWLVSDKLGIYYAPKPVAKGP